MTLQFDLAGAQIDGARDYQEDAFLITQLHDADGNPAALIIVADGMGGHAAGNVASNMAVQAFNKNISSNYPCDNISEILHDSVLKANKSIAETIAETPALNGMGCTMVAAVLEHDTVFWASIGDSHLYLLRDKELFKLNADHSYGGFLDRMEEAGTPIKPEEGLSRNMLMSAITGGEINEIDCPKEGYKLQEGDSLIICSDGLDTLSEGKIIQYIEWSETPKECADALLEGVSEANMPKQDNTTVVAVHVALANAAPELVEEVELGSRGIEFEETLNPQSPTANARNFSAEKNKKTNKKTNKKITMGIATVFFMLLLVGAGIAFYMMKGEKPNSITIHAPVVEDLTQQETRDEMLEKPAPALETPVENDFEKPNTKEEKTANTAPSTVEKVPPNKEFSDTLKDGSNGPIMVRIPAGSFLMGTTSSRHKEAQPRHKVDVEHFAMSKYEITFAEYDRYAKANNKKLPDDLYSDRDTHAVVFVSWDDAFYYAKWLSKQTGKKYRLPTEAEWEYAANSGKNSPFWWGYEEKAKMAHCFGCGSGLDPRKGTIIGSFSANPFGLHDTAGNVAEWVKDCWHNSYKEAPDTAEVWEGGDCSYRVVRGGSFSSPPSSIRSQKRDRFRSDKTYDNIGIRLVRELN